MIYRLEEHTGMIYTEEEYLSHYKRVLPDTPHLREVYDSLPIVEVPEGKLVETRDKLLHIYAHSEVPEMGNIIASSFESPDKWIVQDTLPENRTIVGMCSNPSLVKVWEGPFVTIVDTHSKRYPLSSYSFIIHDFSDTTNIQHGKAL